MLRSNRFRGSILALAAAGLCGGRPALAGSDPSDVTMEVVGQILTERQAATKRPFEPVFADDLRARLAALAPDDLQAFRSNGSLGDLRKLLAEGVTTHALGDPRADLVYTPVVPCRVVDTRIDVSVGPLTGGSQRNFYVTGASNFADQGGNPAGCGIPNGPATAVAVNMAVVTPAGPGNLRVWAVANPQPGPPLASALNYGPVSGLVALANGALVPLCDPVGAGGCGAGDMRVQVDVSATDLVIDVVGYFRRVPTESIKSFVVTEQKAVNLPLSVACSNPGNIVIRVDAPVAGKVVVQGQAIVSLNHSMGTNTVPVVFIDSAENSCPGAWGYDTGAAIPATAPSGTPYQMALPLIKVFNVAAGSQTKFFLNARMLSGAGRFDHGSLTATFVPY